MVNYYKYIRPFVFLLDEEFAHNVSIKALKYNLLPKYSKVLNDSLVQNLWGLSFLNPVGLAAGYDKNASAVASLSKQGFGFIETGTVTPNPQDGNPKPRIFRLQEDEAIINRMGFNNKGMENYYSNLSDWQKVSADQSDVIVGANIGKNKLSPNDSADYITMMNKIYDVSDYITINISSPNTPNLRDMQKQDLLDKLLQELTENKSALMDKYKKNVPLILKLAPDLTEQEQEDISAIVVKYKIDGLIISNTTIGQRDELLCDKNKGEQGGLSGKPVFDLSTKVLANIYRLTKGAVPIIAAGGISSAEDAYKKIRSGASLVQIYSALIYSGFGLINEVNQGLVQLLEADGFDNISQAIGVDVE